MAKLSRANTRTMAARCRGGRRLFIARLLIYASARGFAINRQPEQPAAWWPRLCLRGRGQPEIRLRALVHEIIGGHGVRKAGRTQTRARVELIPVAGTLEIAVAHRALAEGAVLVRADVGDRVERAVLADNGDALAPLSLR